MAVSHVKSNPVANMTGTVTVFGSGGVTETKAATDLVRPVDWNSAHNQFMTISGNIGANSTASGSNIVFQAAGNISLFASTDTLIFSAPVQTVQTQGMVSLQGSTGAIVFSNSNGITFGGNASTITASHNGLTTARASNDAIGLNTALTGNGVAWTVNSSGLSLNVPAFLTTAAQSNHSHGNPSLALTNLSGTTASNSAGLTLSLSAAAPGGGGGPAISAAGSSGSTGTIVFSNSNGVSFGMNGNTITATVTPGAAAGVAAVAAGTQQATSGTVTFVNSNGLTFGMSGSSQITASHNGITTARASNDAIGLNSAFTAGPLAMTINSSGLSLNAASAAGTTSGFTGGASISGSMTHNTAGLAISLSHPAWITTAMASNAATISNINISAGTTSTNASAFTFNNANGITFGLGTGASAGSITASHNGLTTARASTDAIGLNTAQTNVTWTVNSSGLSLNAAGYAGTGTTFNGTNASASMTLNSNGLRLDLSAANGGGGVNSGTFYATGNTTQSSSGTIALSSIIVRGTGGVSAGISNGSIVVSGPALTSLSVTGALSASSNGSTISLGVGTVTVSATSNTTQASSGTVNLNGLIFAGAGGASVGISNGSIVISGATGGAGGGIAAAAGTQTGTSGTVNFANSNGITFGMSGSTQITASHNGLTTARASNDAVGLNTALTAGPLAWTVNSSGISLNAASAAGTTSGFTGANISASITHNTAGLAMSMSVAAGGGVNPAASASNGSFAFTTLNFSNANNVTFGTSVGGIITASVAAPGAAAENNAINLLGANTAGNTTATGSTIGWSGVNLTLSGTNASQVVISAPATSSLVGVSGINISTNASTISIYQNPGSFYANGQYILGTTTQTVGQSTSIVFPFDLKEPENPAFMRMPHTVSVASTSFASTANTTYSFNQQETHNLVLYSRGTGASSQSLISMFSTSASVRMSINIQRNSTNNISVTHGLTFPNSGGTSSLSFSYAATNSSDQVSTTHMTVLSGLKMWDTQFSTFLDRKMYWLAYGMSTTQTTQGTANLSAARLLHSQIVITQPNNTIGAFGVANAASNQWVPGHGSFSTAGGGTTSAFPISAVSSSSSHGLPYIQIQRIA